MKSAKIDRYVKTHQFPAVEGVVTVSWVRIKVGASTYHEVAIRDTRSLNRRDHKWRPIDSYLCRHTARRLFAAIVEAVENGQQVHGCYWYGSEVEVMTERRVGAKKVKRIAVPAQ